MFFVFYLNINCLRNKFFKLKLIFFIFLYIFTNLLKKILSKNGIKLKQKINEIQEISVLIIYFKNKRLFKLRIIYTILRRKNSERNSKRI